MRKCTGMKIFPVLINIKIGKLAFTISQCLFQFQNLGCFSLMRMPWESVSDQRNPVHNDIKLLDWTLICFVLNEWAVALLQLKKS